MRSLRQPAGLRTHAHKIAACPNWREAEKVLGGTQTHELPDRDRDVEPVTLDEVLGRTVDDDQATLGDFE